MSNTFGGSFTETIGRIDPGVLTLECPVQSYRTLPQHKRTLSLSCTLSSIERFPLFSVVPRAPPAPEAEHGDADDEADHRQDEDDAARDHAHRVHCKGGGNVEELEEHCITLR